MDSRWLRHLAEQPLRRSLAPIDGDPGLDEALEQ
jgi:hypothetical protein